MADERREIPDAISVRGETEPSVRRPTFLGERNAPGHVSFHHHSHDGGAEMSAVLGLRSSDELPEVELPRPSLYLHYLHSECRGLQEG